MWDLEEEKVVEPFRVTAGFIAFVTAMFLPVLIAVVIYLGAWAVSGEVYAAEAAQADSVQQGLFNDPPPVNGDTNVAGWKKTLVVICPLH